MEPNDHLQSDEDLSISFERLAVPDATDILFGPAGDWWNNACLLPGAWGYIAGYKIAADKLVSDIESNRQDQDKLVYPIVFLYRQYLELAVKGLIQDGRRLLDIDDWTPITHHRIDRLWPICSGLLAQISPGDSVEEVAQIGRLIDEFCRIDPTSMAFRYPSDKEGKPSLVGLGVINLRNIRDVISKISVILDGASYQLDHYLSIKSEILGSAL